MCHLYSGSLSILIRCFILQHKCYIVTYMFCKIDKYIYIYIYIVGYFWIEMELVITLTMSYSFYDLQISLVCRSLPWFSWYCFRWVCRLMRFQQIAFSKLNIYTSRVCPMHNIGLWQMLCRGHNLYPDIIMWYQDIISWYDVMIWYHGMISWDDIIWYHDFTSWYHIMIAYLEYHIM